MGLKAFILKKIIAQNKSEISQKPFDIYTISHILMGIISYMVFYSFLDTFFPALIINDVKWISVISVLIWGLLWEFIENFALINTRLKVNKIEDSLRNSLTDVVATGVGGFIPFGDIFTGVIILISLSAIGLYNWVKKSAMG